MGLYRGEPVYIVFRATHHEELRAYFPLLAQAADQLERDCADNDFLLYPNEDDYSSRNWKAAHIGVWALYRKRASPTVGMEKPFVRKFLEAIRPLGDYIDELLKAYFPEFFKHLSYCRDRIPPELRYDCAAVT